MLCQCCMPKPVSILKWNNIYGADLQIPMWWFVDISTTFATWSVGANPIATGKSALAMNDEGDFLYIPLEPSLKLNRIMCEVRKSKALCAFVYKFCIVVKVYHRNSLST